MRTIKMIRQAHEFGQSKKFHQLYIVLIVV